MITSYTPLDDYRYERKYTTDFHFRGAVEILIRQNPALFRQSFQPRQVNNIYFDTPGFDCFFDNHFGIGQRWKARIRWYGQMKQHVKNPVLELKIKKGYLNTKKAWILLPIHFSASKTDLISLRETLINSGLPDDIRTRLLSMKPVLINTYHRRYYQAKDRRIRLTVDNHLEYLDFHDFINHSSQVYREKGKIVVELKYLKEQDEEGRKIANHFPFRLGKNSKFVSGMKFIRAGIEE
jgi:hypothetical protein